MNLKKSITAAGLAFSFGLCFGSSANAADGTSMETAATVALDDKAQTGPERIHLLRRGSGSAGGAHVQQL